MLATLAGRLTTGLVALLLAASPCLARAERLELRHVTLELPGPPARLIPTDLDGDGFINPNEL